MAATESRKIGWIGLGSMGLAMAKNVQRVLQDRHWPPLRYFNRTASKGIPLQEMGGVPCNDAQEVVRDSDVTFISLSDDAAVRGVISEIIQLSQADLGGKIIVDTTTVHPDTCEEVAQTLEVCQATLLAAPVFGPTPIAEQGKLLVALGRPPREVEAVIPLIKDAFAREVMVVGKTPEKALLLKTLSNFAMAGIMEIIAEGHVLAEKGGLGSDIFEKLLELNFGTLAHSDSTRMTQGIYMPGAGQSPWSDLNLAIKDVGHGIDYASRVGTRLKVGETALEHLNRAKMYSIENDERPLDSSALYGVVREDAGLDFATEFVKERDF